MRDHPLPWPETNVNNPEPTDAPKLEEVDALKALVELRDAVTGWLILATGTSLAPVAYRDIVGVLLDAAGRCVAADTDSSVNKAVEGKVATHIPGRIIIHPHPPVSIDGVCARCHLRVTHPTHGQIVEGVLDGPQQLLTGG